MQPYICKKEKSRPLVRHAEPEPDKKEKPHERWHSSFHAVFDLVRPGGFEPLAFGVGVQRSIQLSYDRITETAALLLSVPPIIA